MKKPIYLLFLFIFLLTACSFGDDDGTQDPPFQSTIRPEISIQLDDILNRPPGSDITDLVVLGDDNSVSASDFTIELQFGQRLILDQPMLLGLNEGLLYSRLSFFEENPSDPGVFDVPVDTLDLYGSMFNKSFADPGSNDAVEFPFDNDRSLSSFLGLEVIADDITEAVEYKYEIEVAILNPDGVTGYYTIDPKIIVNPSN
ncbi:hypothetical protein [Winogradskyella sp. A2]|uniref:hypothetical protein n=1 Tax=Winogradskyella sp. A2 TaxID=3366944 RepID=UPI00398C5DC9